MLPHFLQYFPRQIDDYPNLTDVEIEPIMKKVIKLVCNEINTQQKDLYGTWGTKPVGSEHAVRFLNGKLKRLINKNPAFSSDSNFRESIQETILPQYDEYHKKTDTYSADGKITELEIYFEMLEFLQSRCNYSCYLDNYVTSNTQQWTCCTLIRKFCKHIQDELANFKFKEHGKRQQKAPIQTYLKTKYNEWRGHLQANELQNNQEVLKQLYKVSTFEELDQMLKFGDIFAYIFHIIDEAGNFIISDADDSGGYFIIGFVRVLEQILLKFPNFYIMDIKWFELNEEDSNFWYKVEKEKCEERKQKELETNKNFRCRKKTS